MRVKNYANWLKYASILKNLCDFYHALILMYDLNIAELLGRHNGESSEFSPGKL